MYLLSGAKDNWWCPAHNSSFENIVTPLRVWIRSSTVGLGCPWLIALFAILISTHNRTSPLFLGITTRGNIHGVGPSTFWIIPCLSRLLSSAVRTFSCESGNDKQVEQLEGWSGLCAVWLRHFSAFQFLWTDLGISELVAHRRVGCDQPAWSWRQSRGGQTLFCSWGVIHGYLVGMDGWSSAVVFRVYGCIELSEYCDLWLGTVGKDAFCGWL